MSSTDELEIREAVVGRLRELLPNARIVHELNVAGTGSNRIDVAAITTQAIVSVEIKSKKDTLSRLGDQWEAFGKCSHILIVAAHEKHFVEWRDERYPGTLTMPRLNHPMFLNHSRNVDRVWRFPRPDPPIGRVWPPAPWTFDPHRDVQRQPQAFHMLNMLWAEELRTECRLRGLAHGTRLARPAMIRDMVWNLTGREIVESVCRALRWREFANADPIIKPEGIGPCP